MSVPDSADSSGISIKDKCGRARFRDRYSGKKLEKLNHSDFSKEFCEIGSLLAAVGGRRLVRPEPKESRPPGQRLVGGLKEAAVAVVAPSHLLTTEGSVHSHQNPVWHRHRNTLASICAHDPQLFLATDFKQVDMTAPDEERAAIDWRESRTARGSEGMVVKLLEFVVRGERGLVQPAVKCRGREYVRIIYRPDFDAEENDSRLRNRGLAGKRSLALREFALGIEALERFVRK